MDFQKWYKLHKSVRHPVQALILNVTSDSFSDGGKWLNYDLAVEHCLHQVSLGANIIDVGACSTRPGSLPLDSHEEWRHLKEMCSRLRARLPPKVLISVDCFRPELLERLCSLHLVDVINDVYSGDFFEANVPFNSIDVCAKHQKPLIVMHMQGTPATMQDNPSYLDVTTEVISFLNQKRNLALSKGVPHVIVDPGIGFGKSFDHNMALMREDFVKTLNQMFPLVMYGISRKKFTAQLHELETGTFLSSPGDRDHVSLKTESQLANLGVGFIRTHVIKQHHCF